MTERDQPNPPKASRLDTARDIAAGVGATALAATGAPAGAVAATALAALNTLVPSVVERQSLRFAEKTAERIALLEADLRELREDMVAASLLQGAMAAARSASHTHLDYLANATARAATTEDEKDDDYAMMLLRLVGDVTATHIRVLQILDDPACALAAARRTGQWEYRSPDGFVYAELVDLVAPDLATDPTRVRAVLGDLERLGLFGEDADHSTVTVIDGGNASPDDERAMPKSATTMLGRALLEFVAPVPGS